MIIKVCQIAGTYMNAQLCQTIKSSNALRALLSNNYSLEVEWIDVILRATILYEAIQLCRK